MIDLERVDQALLDALRGSRFAGAVVLVGTVERVLHQRAFGYACSRGPDLQPLPLPEAMTVEHLFDLASLTKIFATTYALMALYSDGLVRLDDPLQRFWPAAASGVLKPISVRHLLAHTSGLPAWVPTYCYTAETDRPAEGQRETQGAGAAVAEVAAAGGARVAGALWRAKALPAWLRGQVLLTSPGTAFRYSDLGFMLLPQVVASVTGLDFPVYLQERLYQPLGLRATLFRPRRGSGWPVVATSHGNPFERNLVYRGEYPGAARIDPTAWQQWRDYTLQGEVNDGNAYHTFGGVAGHAGLFGTAGDLATLLQALLRVDSGDTVFTTGALTEFMGGHNGLGWMLDADTLHASHLPAGSAGHTGFTGTHFIVNRRRGLFYLLLTNRQHCGLGADGNYPDLRPLRTALSAAVFGDAA